MGHGDLKIFTSLESQSLAHCNSLSILRNITIPCLTLWPIFQAFPHFNVCAWKPDKPRPCGAPWCRAGVSVLGLREQVRVVPAAPNRCLPCPGHCLMTPVGGPISGLWTWWVPSHPSSSQPSPRVTQDKTHGTQDLSLPGCSTRTLLIMKLNTGGCLILSAMKAKCQGGKTSNYQDSNPRQVNPHSVIW